MHDAYIPRFFYRHDRPLRGVMIDNQPWFSAYDFARLLGLHHPQALHRRLRPFESCRVLLQYASGNEEEVPMINESGLYRALVRFGHPECRGLEEWMSREVIPTLRDLHARDEARPRRVMLSWQTRRLVLLEWQGELWMPWNDMPRHLFHP
ncbi:BRO-N domain-containing protein [Metapseudomonas furukawaii]|jgi:prophage antirepressor-like protein|uniref:Uncharacterized protein n=1 Tax=Metapseudomonas furukawaii TaxID=1149133 RepID=L8MN44_METFU|nr:BRO family protein [Pseudomonas furukawaii]ELS25281.1 hypothetical protein ppKF707_1491 [Pseudomonas furukawaii]ELS28244.1 hypothetical protein ppKF707_5944 [Pseudomonas furukawaii]BAU76386.1 hypothetical protein KF707C_46980 [Pseudomonas furukawaii]